MPHRGLSWPALSFSTDPQLCQTCCPKSAGHHVRKLQQRQHSSDRIHTIFAIRADGDGSVGRNIPELGETGVLDQSRNQPSRLSCFMHSQQFRFGIHRDADLLETSQQPGFDPCIQRNDEVSPLRMTELQDGAHRRMCALRNHLALAHVQILAQNDHLFMFHTGTHNAASIATDDSTQAQPRLESLNYGLRIHQTSYEVELGFIDPAGDYWTSAVHTFYVRPVDAELVV